MRTIKVTSEDGLPMLVNTDKIVFADEYVDKDIRPHARLFMENRLILRTNISLDQLHAMLAFTK